MNQTRCTFTLAALASLLAFGCAKKSTTAEPEAAALQVEKAFTSADVSLKKVADDANAALKQNDNARAFVQYQQLNSAPSLTPEQRMAISQQIMLAHQRLRESAEKGDRAAKELLERYRATK